MDKCTFCEEFLSDGQPTTRLGVKGCDGIDKASELRNSSIIVIPGQIVHIECRKKFCAPNSITSITQRSSSVKDSTGITSLRRSMCPTFNYKDNCLFCGHPDKYKSRKLIHKLMQVRTKDFQTNILRLCKERNDSWSETISGRLEYVQDLHAADAVYHALCSTNFRTGKQIPQPFIKTDTPQCKRLKHGRPSNLVRAEAFIMVTDFLEANDEEQLTIHDLIEVMQEFLEDTDCEPYGFTYMKEQLQKHFGDKIIITEIQGKPNVVTFRHTAASLIHEFYQMPKKGNSEAETIRIIETAAKLIISDVKRVEQLTETYPGPDEIQSITSALAFLPESLQVFLSMLAKGKDIDRKVASLGHAIMQFIRPRALTAPLQISLAIQLYHQFHSEFLLDSLHAHGFCSSYHDVKTFERCAAATQGINIPDYKAGQFIQYVADNVDHNVNTIDGLNTFHGMGIIATVTPGTKSSSKVPRSAATMQDVQAIGRINIQHMTSACNGLNSLQFMSLDSSKEYTSKLDLLWKASLTLHSPRPGWLGMMQAVQKGQHPGQSSIFFLPMIDLNPSNMSCIYSTLKFVCDHAKRYDTIPIITFDQPLWWKALTIVESEPEDSDLRRIVLRLGGFHTLMSFLGAIGYIMAGSGLRQVLEKVYADNTVTHMLTGKAYARAFRGHLLVDAALNTIICRKLFGSLVPFASQAYNSIDQVSKVIDNSYEKDIDMKDESTMSIEETDVDGQVFHVEYSVDSSNMNPTSVDLFKLQATYDSLIAGDIVSVEDNHELQIMESAIKTERQSMKDLRTAQLWLHYMDMVDILRKFIRSERTGNWKLHLQALHDMLPYLAAAGHRLYTKSIHIYLQRLAELPSQHPDIQKLFEDGFHVVRRSDRYWAGLSTDLVIEQVLMRSLKTTGGLTRGGGMSESQRLLWLHSSPICAEVNNAMQEYTSVRYTTSDQHKELTQARQKRDTTDTDTIISYLSVRNPFADDPSLRSIDSGITASDTVNVDDVTTIGKNILEGMIGQTVVGHVFKKKNKL